MNTNWDARATYNGNHNHWLIQDPTYSYVTWHELGHAQLRSIYRGEEEAIVNYLLTYIRHVKFGDDFVTAFKRGRDGSNYEPDDAAVHWMIVRARPCYLPCGFAVRTRHARPRHARARTYTLARSRHTYVH